jgi:hypothetical protein
MKQTIIQFSLCKQKSGFSAPKNIPTFNLIYSIPEKTFRCSIDTFFLPFIRICNPKHNSFFRIANPAERTLNLRRATNS